MKNELSKSDGSEPPYSRFVYEPLAPEIENQVIESIVARINEAKLQNKKMLIPIAFEGITGMDSYSYDNLNHSSYLKNLFKALPQPNPEDFPQTKEELTVLSKSRKALLEKIGLKDGKLEVAHKINRINIGMGREYHNYGITNLGDTVYYHKVGNYYDDWDIAAIDFFTVNISESELKEIIRESSVA